MRIAVALYTLCLLGLFCAVPAQAAQVYFGVPSPAFGVGAAVDVGVFLGSDGESINAVEGTIRYPADLLKLTDIRPAGSLISFWVEQPRLVAQGDVRFAGIVPGGFQGDRGALFSLTFESIGAGTANINATQVAVLRNDGEGTTTTVRPAPLSLEIQANGPQPTFLLPTDTEPPEPFAPSLAADPNLFNGEWFVVFAAEDKQSGVRQYEIWEGPSADSIQSLWMRPQWRLAESPSRLEQQDGHARVMIRVTDRAGNERIAEVPARLRAPWYEQKLLWGILGVLILILGGGILWQKKRGRR